MTKKSSETRTIRRRNATRRARIAGERHAKRLHRATAGKRRTVSGQLHAHPVRHIIAAQRADRVSTNNEVAAAKLGLRVAAIRAHELLPLGELSRGAEMGGHLTLALRELDDPLSSSECMFQAIMVLGHTPDERALAALRRHVSRDGMLAGMARVAIAECLWWMENAEPAPRCPPQREPLLN